ncbi:MAG: hypothetical protein RR448_10730 [Niameybacter sp.]
MSDFFSKFKQTLDKGMNTVSVKSNTAIEVNKVKTTIRTLSSTIQQQKLEIGNTFYTMYLEDAFDLEKCKELCQHIQALEKELKENEAEVEMIKAKEEMLLADVNKPIEVVVAPVAEATSEGVLAPEVEAVSEGVLASEVEAASEGVLAPVVEGASEGALEPVIKAVSEGTLAPVVETESEGTLAPVVEVVSEATLEPVIEAASEVAVTVAEESPGAKRVCSCGAVLADTMKFCVQCGKRVE